MNGWNFHIIHLFFEFIDTFYHLDFVTVALSDGNKVLIDVNLRPNLNHKGIVSKNTKGEWNVMCVDQIEINRKGAEMAGEICSMLGFSGYSFFNVTPITSSDGMKVLRNGQSTPMAMQQVFSKHLYSHFDQSFRYMRKRHNNPNEFWSTIPSDMGVGIHFSEVVGTPRQCTGFYIECVPHAVIPVVIPLPDGIRPHPTKPSPPKPVHTVKPIVPVIQPHQVPTVVVPAVNNSKPVVPTDDHLVDEHYPWSVGIYINGQLACNGILFDRLWVGVEGSCVTSVKYEYN